MVFHSQLIFDRPWERPGIPCEVAGLGAKEAQQQQEGSPLDPAADDRSTFLGPTFAGRDRDGLTVTKVW